MYCKNNCPMNGNCRVENLVYKSVVSATDKSKEHVYIGVVEAALLQPHHVIEKSETQKRHSPFNFFMGT